MNKTGIKLSTNQQLWLAGLFEGEASFTFTSSGYPRICLQMTDRDIVQSVADIFGVNVQERARQKGRMNCKPIFILAICKAQILCDTLTQLLPFMGERRSARINEQLSYFKNKGITPSFVSDPR